jgi:UDP-N-acetylmuramoyl-tripeptide--D-alanyl-D-alanine ligase
MIGQKSERLSSKRRQLVKRSIGKVSQLTCSDILKATGGSLLHGDREASFPGLSTDSRTLQKGDIFIALRGEQFDGHAFVQKALKQGAAGAIVQKEDLASCEADAFTSKLLIAVPETLRALGDIARYWRDRFSLPVIGVTGSNGKTTTKELIAFLLGERFRILKNPGNFNNLVGLPLTLLDLDLLHQVAVVEMGTNRPGEIKRLTEIARPTVGLITNIGEAHLEGMGSLQTLVAEKGELFRTIGEEGILAVNQNDPHVSSLARDCPAKKIGFGIERKADVMIDRIQERGVKGTRFRLTIGTQQVSVDFPVMGGQFIQNVAAAVAVASLFDMSADDIKRRLRRFKPLPMRMEIISLRGVTFINDAYNANPPSVEMALRALSDGSGKARAFVVFGDMLELGGISQTAHQAVGRLIAKLNIAGVFLLGDHAPDVAGAAVETGMSPRNVWMVQRHQEIADLLKDLVRPGDWILVKGSRRMRMETVIEIFEGEA